MTDDPLEMLHKAVDRLDGVEFVRHSECSLRVDGITKHVWVRAPSRQSLMWRVAVHLGTEHRLNTMQDVIKWLLDRRG